MQPWWSLPVAEVLGKVGATPAGLTEAEAAKHRAGRIMEGLRARLSLKATVLRGTEHELTADTLAAGDIVLLGAAGPGGRRDHRFRWA